MHGKTQNFRRPTADEQTVLRRLHVKRLVAPKDLQTCDQILIQEHYLHSAQLVGEHRRYAVLWKGQWLALATWSAPAEWPRGRGPKPETMAGPNRSPLLEPKRKRRRRPGGGERVGPKEDEWASERGLADRGASCPSDELRAMPWAFGGGWLFGFGADPSAD